MGPASTTPRLRHLTQLRLDAACVGDDLLDEVAQLRELKLLVLWHAKVTDEGLSRLSDCRMLEELYLHDSTQVGEKGMAFLADHPRLTRLPLRYTAADDR